jgi:hypothetical protein
MAVQLAGSLYRFRLRRDIFQRRGSDRFAPRYYRYLRCRCSYANRYSYQLLDQDGLSSHTDYSIGIGIKSARVLLNRLALSLGLVLPTNFFLALM